MDIVSLCPFVASKVSWQAHSGAFALTVIVKATFVLQQGVAKLAPEQDPISEQDRFYDDDPRRSVRIPSDVSPYKPRADVLLVGHAYAPGKQPVRSLITRFVVGEMDKSIEVFCERSFRLVDGQLIEGKRFTEMPLVWERASGGPESANPVGKRFDGPGDSYGMVTIGNLQPLGHFVSKRSDTFVPVCYAPVAPTWPGRTQRLGRLSRAILEHAWNAQPVASDLDPTFFMAAPPDQNVAEIRANERIVLENLHPEHVHLVTSLPGLRPRAIADRATGEREEIALVGDTLLVDTDRRVCTVVWRGRMGLRTADEAGRIAVTMEGAMAEKAEPDELQITLPPQSPHVQPDPEDLVGQTMIGSFASKASAQVMPFAGAPVPKPGVEAIRNVADGVLPFGQSGPRIGIPSPPAQAASIPGPPIVPPAFVPPPPVVTPLQTESVWASGATTAAPPAASRETIGEAAAAAATAAVAASSATTDRASQDGALAASNAAAGATPWSAPKREVRIDAPMESPGIRAEVQAEMVQLIWFDPDMVPRARRVAAWKKVLEALEHHPRSRDLEMADGAKDAWEIEDRQEIFEIMAKGARTDGKGVEEALDNSIGDDGKFAPPLVLLAGELEMPFDELETLKAAMSTATPLITPADELLRTAVNVAKDFIQVPGLVATPAVSEGLTARIRDAFAKEKKALAPEYLDQQIERGLLANRSYQKREVFGGTYLRGLLFIPSEKTPLIAYLPLDLAKKLPMWKRFRARLIADVHPAQDQYETVPRAVKVVAIARVGGKRGAT